MVAPVLIFAIGNESRGDDALGPLLLRKLEGWLATNKPVEGSTPIPPPTPPLKGGEFSAALQRTIASHPPTLSLKGGEFSTSATSSANSFPPTLSLKEGEFSLPLCVSQQTTNQSHTQGVFSLPPFQGEGRGGDGLFELLEEFQLQVEHAMDMKDRRLVLFIDAGIETELPFSFYRAQVKDAPVLYSHALEPESLLKVYEQFYQEPPPATFILCIRGEAFELGEALSSEAAARLELAFEFCKNRLLQADIKQWDCYGSQKTVEQSMRNEDNPHPVS